MENYKRLTRPRSGRWIGGVCAGVANYFGWDVAILRLAYLLLTFGTAFCGIPVYLILWICMPESD